MIKQTFFSLALLVTTITTRAQKNYVLTSPDKTISVSIITGDSITYQVTLDNKQVIGASRISFHTNNSKPDVWKVKKAQHTSHNEWLTPVVFQKTGRVHDLYNQLRIEFANSLALEWRVYNNGIAWHWATSFTRNFEVLDEQATFSLDKNGCSWYPKEDDFYSHNERQYRNYRIDSIDAKKLGSLPALFDVN